MMEQNSEVKVGDRIFYWDLDYDKFTGCEFKKLDNPVLVEIIKVPDPKPEITDEPRTRGSVVTIEGDDEFIAVRFTDADYMPYPFIGSFSCTGDADIRSWGEIVTRAAGRKIVVHEMVEIPKVPDKVFTYPEWCTLPKNELMKYKWRDCEGDLWWYESPRDDFLPEGDQDDLDFYIKDFFPLTRDEKIG